MLRCGKRYISFGLSADVTLQATEGHAGRSLLPFEIVELADSQLSNLKFGKDCDPAFKAMVRGFVLDSISRRVARFRELHGLYGAEERELDLDEHTDFNMGATGMQYNFSF